MVAIRVILFKESSGSVPLLDFLDALRPDARAKCVARIQRLQEMGHALRRPEADYVRDGIYELRCSFGHENYRLLYFFQSRNAVILSHGFMKQQAQVPERELRKALMRKQM